jgi:molecular chaperone GrpE (heat shock protein)
MKKWLQNLIYQNEARSVKEETPFNKEMSEELYLREKEIQSLRIEQSEDHRKIEALTHEIDRLRTRQEEMVDHRVANKIEALISDLAGPASQTITQADLVENQGKPVQVRDILSISQRMVRALVRHGAVIEGKPGETTAYDPNRHIPIQPGLSLQAGEPIVIRFAGVSYGNKMIYKAIVEQEIECRGD